MGVYLRLSESHTGEYLAMVIANCLKRFGIDKKVGLFYFLVVLVEIKFFLFLFFQLHTICMDNASNCDATASELTKHIPTFRGALSRSRCMPHVVNLVAKVRIFRTLIIKVQYTNINMYSHSSPFSSSRPQRRKPPKLHPPSANVAMV